MTNLDSIFKSRDITLPTKVHLVKGMVFPVVLYGCETWTVKKAERRRIELCCWRRLLRVPWTARRSNQSILKEISPGISLEGMKLDGQGNRPPAGTAHPRVLRGGGVLRHPSQSSFSGRPLLRIPSCLLLQVLPRPSQLHAALQRPCEAPRREGRQAAGWRLAGLPTPSQRER